MFIIATDSTADLPVDYVEKNNIKICNLSTIIDGVVYGKEREISAKDTYAAMREGKLPTTSQVNPDEAIDFFDRIIKEEPGSKEILYVAFSSGLSGTCNNIFLAANEYMEEHPDVTIKVVDSVAATLGEGLEVIKVCQMRDNGASLEETANWLEENKKHIVTCFTVDDLYHLHRGGRVSKATAFVGTLVSIKPTMYVDDEGKLLAFGKAMGRKKSIKALVDYMAEHTEGQVFDDNYIVTIAHGDCEEDAILLKNMIVDAFGIKNFVIEILGPVIGAHAGPGTLALSFMGIGRAPFNK